MFWLEIVINVLDDVVVFFSFFSFSFLHWCYFCTNESKRVFFHSQSDCACEYGCQCGDAATNIPKTFLPASAFCKLYEFLSLCVCMGICVEERDHTVLIYNDNFTNNGHYNKLCLDEQWKSWKIITFNFSHENFSIWLWSN